MNLSKLHRYVTSCLVVLFLSLAATAEQITDTTGIVFTDLTAPVGTSPTKSVSGSSVLSGYAANNLFDNVANGDVSRWIATSRPAYVIYEFETATLVNAFGFAVPTWNINSRSPQEFKFEGSNDGENWTMLTEETIAPGKAWSSTEWAYFQFENTKKYTHYKFTVTKTNGNDQNRTSLAELDLYCLIKITPFTVTATPAEKGVVDPAYGSGSAPTDMPASFDSFTTWTSASGDEEATCNGYAVYKKSGDEWTSWLTGTTTNITIASMPQEEIKVVWSLSSRVNITTRESANGSSTGAGWKDYGESVTLTATPAAGYRFVCWQNDSASQVSTANPLVFSAESGCAYTPVFVPDGVAVRFISPSGSNENDGLTPATAIYSLYNAVTNIGASAGRIFVLPGTYDITNNTVVSSAIEIIGLSADKTQTVLVGQTYKSGWNTLGYRIVQLDHADSRVRNLTLSSGRKDYGGNAQITANGGVIEDCILMSGVNPTYLGGGANVCLYGGRVQRCVLRNGSGNDNNSGANGGAFWMNAGVIENCLIRNNSGRHACGVVKGTGKVINCTFTKNNHKTLGGLYSADDAQVVNCIISGNTSSDDTTGHGAVWAGKAESFTNCLSSESLINDGCFFADPAFTDADNDDYTLTVASPARDKGVPYADTGAVSPKDLAGQTRVMGAGVDLGAYEYAASGLACDFAVTPAIGIIPLDVGLVATVEGAQEGATLTYDWTVMSSGQVVTNFAVATSSCVWPCNLSGVFTVSLTVSIQGGTSATMTRQDVLKSCQREIYVAADNPSAAFPYATVQTAAATIRDAIDAAVPGCTVHVLPGDYKISNGLTLDFDVSVVGTTGNPADVIVRRTSGSLIRPFALNSPGAFVANLTIRDGSVDGYGGLVRIDAQGGTISNCWLVAGSATGYYAGGGGVFASSANALVTHCVISNCDAAASQVYSGVSAYLSKGRIANTLITAGTASSIANANVWIGAEAVMENCTVVKNAATNAVGVQVANGAVVRNTAVFDSAKGSYSGTASAFDHCATDGEAAINDSCKLMTAAAFKDYANGDYTPTSGGALYNAGATVANPAAIDLAGNPRVVGSKIDIGCYEGKASGLIIVID